MNGRAGCRSCQVVAGPPDGKLLYATPSAQAQFAVNLFAEDESDIEPQDTIALGEAPVEGQDEDVVGRREWWRWPALAALGVLLVEWVVHWRRQTSGLSPLRGLLSRDKNNGRSRL